MSFARLPRLFAVAMATVLFPSIVQATDLTWYGHAAFKIVTPSGRVLLVDPWITNPANSNAAGDLAEFDKVDLILVTHGHGDHVGNAVEIAEKTGAHLVATFDLQKAIVQYRAYPKEQAGMATAGNFGGEIELLDGDIKVAFIPAIHGSTVETAGMPKEGSLEAAGQPGGFLISIKDGPVIYHAGDTDVFADMALVPTFRPVDVMLVPIGDKFTMGPARAAVAAGLVQPRTAVIPMHFGTFPVLSGSPAAFKEALAKEGVATPMREMKPGETVKF